MSGRGRGLRLTLDAEPHEYYGLLNYDGTGFRVLVHDQLEGNPLMELQSTMISTGYSYEVRIERQEVRGCVISSSKFLKFNSKFQYPWNGQVCVCMCVCEGGGGGGGGLSRSPQLFFCMA